MAHEFHTQFSSVKFETKEELDNYLFTHEQYAFTFIKKLVPLNPKPVLCSIGLHNMRHHSYRDGGGIGAKWGYCKRCLRSYYAGHLRASPDHDTF